MFFVIRILALIINTDKFERIISDYLSFDAELDSCCDIILSLYYTLPKNQVDVDQTANSKNYS